MLKLRKDVKTGLIVGGGVLAIGLIYLLIGGSGSPQQQVADTTPAPTTSSDDLTPPGADDRRIGSPADSSADPVAPAPADPTPPPTNTDTGPAVANNDAAPLDEANDPWAAALFRNELPPMMTETPRPTTPNTVAPGGRQVGANAPAATDLIPPSQGGRVPATHKVQRGETLSSIAAHYYGHERYHAAILKANPGLVPERIRAGTEIKLPDISTAQAAVPAPAPRAPVFVTTNIDPATQYRVEPGDSLHRIAFKLYGDDRQWIRIYELNKDAIGSDPAKLKVGQVLKLPAR